VNKMPTKKPRKPQETYPPEGERRRFPRHPWVIPAEIRTPGHGTFQGALLNMGRGGAMVESGETIPRGDRLSFRIEAPEDPSGELVFHGITVWQSPGGNGRSRHGVVLPEDQRGSYQRFRRACELTGAKTTARVLDLPFLEVTPGMVEPKALATIKRDLACSLNCIPLKLRGDRLMVAMSAPDDSRAIKKLELFGRCRIEPVVATPSSIRSALAQCLGVRFVSTVGDGSGMPRIYRYRPNRQARIVAIVSCVPGFGAKHLAENMAVILRAEGSRVLLADLDGESAVLSEGISGVATQHCDWLMVTLSSDTRSFFLDWAIRADETLVLVSPKRWQNGCVYADALFSRFVEVHKDRWVLGDDLCPRQRVLTLSVVCGVLSDTQEGFKSFSRMDARIHRELDMREPGFDIDLHYVGGVVDDGKNLQKAQKAGVPLTEFRPRSPASQCLTHIARSLLRPTPARDPRVPVNRSLLTRLLG